MTDASIIGVDLAKHALQLHGAAADRKNSVQREALHEKNDYLQGVAREVAHLRGEEFEPLGKDALSRIRRYYSRRSLADLKLDQIDRATMRAALPAMADAIRSNEVTKVMRTSFRRGSRRRRGRFCAILRSPTHS